MQCPTCKREMAPLFTTQACDYCDFGVAKDKLHSGFVVYNDNPNDPPPREEYVFRTRMDADRWRSASDRAGHSIFKVWSLSPFQWEMSRGTLRDVVLADHIYEVYPNHRYEPLPNRCFLASEKEIETSSPVDAYDELPF